MRIRKLNNEELAEILNAKVEELDPKQMFEMLDKIIDKLTELNGVGFAKKFSREETMAVILLEMYKKGFADALVLWNEVVGDITQKGKSCFTKKN